MGHFYAATVFWGTQSLSWERHHHHVCVSGLYCRVSMAWMPLTDIHRTMRAITGVGQHIKPSRNQEGGGPFRCRLEVLSTYVGG